MEEQLIKQCREVLKKNNLHPVRKLGRGGFSIVFLVQKIELGKSENQLYSVKCISKRQIVKRPSLQKYISDQISNWRELSHQNIVKLLHSFEDQGWIFMIMEYCDQGNLQYVQNSREARVFSLPEAISMIKQIVCGLEYMHSKNLIHRDIKAENVLLTKVQGSLMIKICDLGFCREDDDSVNTFCGTTNYMAPQIFEKKTYDMKVDIWALGILFYSMIFGEFPFKSLNIYYEIFSKCEKGFTLKNIKFKKNVLIAKSDLQQLQLFFEEVFRIDPAKRIGLSQLLKYKWFAPQKISRNTTAESDSSEDQNIFQNDKCAFIKQILNQIQQAKFLNNLEEMALRYYINKILMISCENRISSDKSIGKQFQQLVAQNNQLALLLTTNIKKHPITNLSELFNHKANTFGQFKQAYRVVIGHVFTKAHRSFSNNLIFRSKIKLKLFCLHVINRVFQRENRRHIFIHYFTWLKKDKMAISFDFLSFQRWIDNESPDKLVQTVEIMNQKFYKAN